MKAGAHLLPHGAGPGFGGRVGGRRTFFVGRISGSPRLSEPSIGVTMQSRSFLGSDLRTAGQASRRNSCGRTLEGHPKVDLSVRCLRSGFLTGCPSTIHHPGVHFCWVPIVGQRILVIVFGVYPGGFEFPLQAPSMRAAAAPARATSSWRRSPGPSTTWCSRRANLPRWQAPGAKLWFTLGSGFWSVSSNLGSLSGQFCT